MRQEHRSVLVGLAVATLLVFGLNPSGGLGGEPSPAYKAELKRTLELRKQRRRTEANAPVGVIQPFWMPPALIIRQTRETHDEIGALLDLLRYGG